MMLPVAADDAVLALVALPRSTASPRLCEVNAKDGATAAKLLSRWPTARYVGLIFADSPASATAASSVLLAVLPEARGTVHIGDKLRSVRVSSALDDCDVMIVDALDETSASAAGTKKLVGDVPNILQRMATDRRNVLIMHGPDCSARAAKVAKGSGKALHANSLAWCATWEELVSRRLVSPLGCTPVVGAGGRAERWCVGRVATDSMCSRRPSLLPERITPALAVAGWASEEVGGLQLGYWWRYFTVIPRCAREPHAAGAAQPDDKDVCLIFKNHVFESWVGGVASVDGGRTFDRVPSLVMPTTWSTARMTHNLAIAALPGSGGSGESGGESGGFVVVGGQFKLRGAARCGRRSGNVVPCRKHLPAYDGLWMAHGPGWRFVESAGLQISIPTRMAAEELAQRSDDAQVAGRVQWRDVRWLFNGTHPGCIERRSRFYASMAHLGTCEFDGRLSLVAHGGTLLLYARANPATHGQRYVQVAASQDGGMSWGPFAFISMDGYTHMEGDVYFFAVSVNPVHPASLLAMFPLAHKFRGCIGVSVSLDGLHWSQPTPLLRCAVHGERAVHHPAAGLVRDGPLVSLYVHENVPGVTSDLTPTPAQMVAHPYLKLPRPRLVRHTLPADALRTWTLATLSTLDNTTGGVGGGRGRRVGLRRRAAPGMRGGLATRRAERGTI